jgi:hypothetical protein
LKEDQKEEDTFEFWKLKEDKKRKKKSLLVLELETKKTAAAVEDENCLGIW